MANLRARTWVVQKNGPLEKLEDNLWTLDGISPVGAIHRRMGIVRRADGTLLFFHAIPCDDATLAEITAWGKPAALVLGQINHGLDAVPFAQKLGLRIYAPPQSAERFKARLDLAGTTEDLPPDPAVRFEPLDGTRDGDTVCVVQSGNRTSLLFSDAVQNSRGVPFLFRVMGFEGGPKVVPAFRMMFTADKKALRAHLERLAASPGLARLVPCHGLIVDHDPAAALRQAASPL